MRSLLLCVLLALAFSAQAQKPHHVHEKSKARSSHDQIRYSSEEDTLSLVDLFVSGNIGFSSGDTLVNILRPSIFSGIAYYNVDAGLEFGSYQFKSERRGYWELKIMGSTQLGIMRGFIALGGGSIFGTSHVVLDIGSGFIYPFTERHSMILQVSTFDGNDHITLSYMWKFH